MGKEFNILEDVDKILDQEFAIFDFEEFLNQLEKAKSILYLGDNAGEADFDKILIGELCKPVTYVVRDMPVINDVTFEDAISSGLNEVVEIMSSGSSAPGTILDLCNEKFVERFNNADMIISKGQGNYEGLSDAGQTVSFMLKAKCVVIAEAFGSKRK